MKKIIAIMLVLLVGLLVLNGCTSSVDDSQNLDSEDPQPPSLPEYDSNTQQAGNSAPQPPALPEE